MLFYIFSLISVRLCEFVNCQKVATFVLSRIFLQVVLKSTLWYVNCLLNCRNVHGRSDKALLTHTSH